MYNPIVFHIKKLFEYLLIFLFIYPNNIKKWEIKKINFPNINLKKIDINQKNAEGNAHLVLVLWEGLIPTGIDICY